MSSASVGYRSSASSTITICRSCRRGSTRSISAKAMRWSSRGPAARSRGDRGGLGRGRSETASGWRRSGLVIVVGEMGLMKQQRVMATVRALAPTRAIAVGADRLESWRSRCPSSPTDSGLNSPSAIARTTVARRSQLSGGASTPLDRQAEVRLLTDDRLRGKGEEPSLRIVAALHQHDAGDPQQERAARALVVTPDRSTTIHRIEESPPRDPASPRRASVPPGPSRPIGACEEVRRRGLEGLQHDATVPVGPVVSVRGSR